MSNFLCLTAGHFTGLPISAPSFMQVLGQIGAWHNQRSELEVMPTVSIRRSIKSCVSASRSRPPARHRGNAVKALLQREDRSLGGWPVRRNFHRNPFCSFCWIRSCAGMTARRWALSSGSGGHGSGRHLRSGRRRLSSPGRGMADSPF